MSVARAKRRDGDAVRLRCIDELLRTMIPAGDELPRVALTDAAGSYVAAYLPGGPRLWVSRHATDGEPKALQGELGHEVAHIQDPHRGRDSGLAFLGFSVLGVAGFLTMIRPWQFGDGRGLAYAIVMFLAGLLLLSAAAAWIRRFSHRAELRADARAVEILSGDREAVLAMLGRAAADHERLSRMQQLAGLLTHPTPAQRREALLAEDE